MMKYKLYGSTIKLVISLVTRCMNEFNNKKNMPN